ncbi:hypothetical protein [Mediterraneibacter gnavus]|uniref:hypothetical protein n=1 Tax=Mediterraneibacter gnavus TaxID=33038 RepID=UPI00366B9EDF
MAVIEVCDICDKKVDMSDGITLRCSDNKGCGFICAEDLGDVVRYERNYDVRVCDKCVKKIKAYCRRHKGVMH